MSDMPEVEALSGPIPDVAPVRYDLEALGYVDREYILRGTASAYRRRNDTDWTADFDGNAPFATRLRVRRPTDSTKFSGTVVVEWLNVSTGADMTPDWGLVHRHLIRSGHAWVGVSAQRAGIDGGGYLQRAVAAGGAIPLGGKRLDLDGFYLDATIVTGLPNSAEIAQEELFAPVGMVIGYDDVNEAIAPANDSRYALNATVWGRTPDAIDVARKIRSGTVAVNVGGPMRPDAPWGGPGYSGIGREGGEEGLREFFEVKHVQWPL